MSDLPLFFGAFHPIVVHLPLGVLAVALALHALALFPRWGSLRPALPWMYGAAAAGAVLAAASGWLLAGPAGGAPWDDHRWFGVGAVGATALAAALTAAPSVRYGFGLLAGAAAAGLTGWTGHLGGALVHGEDHLTEYAPAALAEALGGDHEASPTLRAEELVAAPPDSVGAYADLIAPVLARKCVACHRAGLAHGGLRLDSYAALAKGGREGGGVSLASELWRRVALPPDHPRFMPTRGVPLSYDELVVLESFLAAPLDSSSTVAEWAEHLDEEVYGAIARVRGLDLRPLPYVERARPTPVPVPADLAYWEVRPLSQQHTTLVAVLAGATDERDAALAELAPLAANVTALDLGGVAQAGAWLAELPPLPHLTELDLSRSDADGIALERLPTFPHLEELILTGTEVDDEALERLADLPALRRVYLFDTPATERGVAALSDARGEGFEAVRRLSL